VSQHKLTKPCGSGDTVNDVVVQRKFVSFISAVKFTQIQRPKDKVLAEELGVSPQAVYAASSRVERDGGLDAEALERWCR
jgi:hypothetical protein